MLHRSKWGCVRVVGTDASHSARKGQLPWLKKAPRRTAQRILEVTLDLFNRFGEPNVSTTAISAELGISPGNLYYHYPAKDALINTPFDQYEEALNGLLQASDSVHNVEDAWFFLHTLFELIWEYRFLYRDLNDLLSKTAAWKPISSPCCTARKGRTPCWKACSKHRRCCPAPNPCGPAHHRYQHGGGTDLLAQLRIRARPAPCAGTWQRPPCPAARRAACSTCWSPTWKPRSVPICKPWRRPAPPAG